MFRSVSIKIAAVFLCLTVSQTAFADTSSRFYTTKVHLTGFGGVETSNRFMAVDSVVSSSNARSQSPSRTEDVGFPALLAPVPQKEPVVTPPTGGGGGGGGRLAPFTVNITPTSKNFGEEGIDVGIYANRYNSIIFYTLDGSDPKLPGAFTLQNGQHFHLTEDTTVRAIAKLNSLWSRRDNEFFDYINTPEEIIEEIIEITKPKVNQPITDLSPKSIIVLRSAAPILSQGSIQEPEFTLHPGLQIVGSELHAAPSCTVEQLKKDWYSIFWMIAFLIMTIAYINERKGHKKHNHGFVIWPHQIRKL